MQKKNGLTMMTYLIVGILSVVNFSSCEKETPQPPKGELTSIEVRRQPLIKDYFMSETFSFLGIEVIANYEGGTTSTVPISELTVQGFNSEDPVKKQLVKVIYKQHEVELEISIVPYVGTSDGEITEYWDDDNPEEITLPLRVRKIAEGTFARKDMKKIILHEGIQEIDYNAFRYCPNLEQVILPASLKVLGKGAFANCNALVKVDMSNSALTILDEELFMKSNMLSEVLLPPTLMRIEGFAFMATKSLKSIILPDALRHIGFSAFRESGIENIALPHNVMNIEDYAFLDCEALVEVTTKGLFTPPTPPVEGVLYTSAFKDVTKLTRLELPNGISVIEPSALSNCPLLSSIIIPSSVKRIKNNAFSNTTLTQVRVESTTPPMAELYLSYWEAFPASVNKIEVPKASEKQYQLAQGWSEYSFKMVGY